MTATLPGGQAIIAGAGDDGLVYRWDAATGELCGEPLQGHRISVKAVTSARQADGRPMFITGCEGGDVLRWDAASGKRIGPPISGVPDGVMDLEIVDLPGGRQILAGLDDCCLYRWDPLTGDPVGRPAEVGRYARIVATHLDRNGIPTVFLLTSGEYNDDQEGEQVTWWRLDSGTRISANVPGTLRAVFGDAGTTRMVLGEPDGSLIVKPLDPDAVSPGAHAQLALWPRP